MDGTRVPVAHKREAETSPSLSHVGTQQHLRLHDSLGRPSLSPEPGVLAPQQ